MFFSRVAAAFAVALTLSSDLGVNAIDAIKRSGRYLYKPDGSRFYLKGLAYQEQGAAAQDPNAPFSEPSSFIDPLANGPACQRDLPYLKQLGINTIRVYSVNSSLDHSTCMKTFSSAGIYVILDLSLPLNGSIDRTAPAWTTNLLDVYLRTVDAFLGFDNILVFNIGNEVVITPNTTVAAPFVKAAARDLKAYLASKSSSALVGYAAINGDSTWIDPLANYLSCDPSGGNSGNTAIDIYGLNDYAFCGASTFAASYAGTVGDFAGYNVVTYFSEYGCNNPYPRPWADVAALFSTQAAPVLSGGIAFSYFPAESSDGEFGMVNISSDGSTVTTSTDFTNLAAAYGNVTFVTDPVQSSAPASAYPACPSQNTSFLASTKLPPTPSDAACQCVVSNLSCRFNPQTSNTTAIIGSLIGTACGLLAQSSLGCGDITADGQTGTYGLMAACDPSTRLSYIMSLYYEANNRNAQQCSFGGNGTVNNKASTASASAVASSCLASSTGTFVPSAPTSTPGSGSTSTSKSGATTIGLVGDSRALLGVLLMIVVSVAGGFLSLA
ncbi:glycoside hydrolase family 72 protein [Russula brevipes]|nr:glycoside hydrolase family 72 protein [Russula brevipes]